MGFFGNDPFDFLNDFFRKFEGDNIDSFNSDNNPTKSRTFSRLNPDSFISTKKRIYLVLDLSNQSNIDIKIEDHKLKNEYGEKVYSGRKLLKIVGSNGEVFESFLLPEDLKTKGYDWSFKNGVLEVTFKK